MMAGFSKILNRLSSPIRPRTLRGKMLFYQTITVLLILLGFGCSLFVFVYRTEERAWQGRQAEAASSAANEISTTLTQVKSALRLLSSLEGDEIAKTNGVVAHLLRRFPDVREILFTDRDGQVLAVHSRGPSRLSGTLDIRHSHWFRAAREGEEYQSEPFLQSLDEPYLIFAFPASGNRLIATRVRMTLLWEATEKIEFGKTGQAYVVDSSGRVIAHQDRQIVRDYQNVWDLPGIQPLLRAPGSEVVKYRNLQGVPVVGASARIDRTNWVVITELEAQEAYASTRQALFLCSMAVVLFGVVGYLVTSRVMKRAFVNPIRQLQVGAENIGRNNLSYRINLQVDRELADLASAFNRMAAVLEERDSQVKQQTAALTEEIAERMRAEAELLHLNEELEDRVDERTAQLSASNEELRREIREREKAEEALRKSEERWRDYIDQANDPIFILDENGVLKNVNQVLCNLTGYTREEMIGHSPMEFISPDLVPQAKDTLEKILNGIEVDQSIVEIISRDGRHIKLEVRGRTFYQDGRLVETFHTARDITEREKNEEAMRQAHAALQESEAQLRALFASMDDVVIVYDREGRYLQIPSTNTDLLYRPPDTLLGRKVEEVLPKSQATLILQHIQRAIEERATVKLEYSLEIDGREIWFSGAISPMQEDKVILVSHNITNRKKAEEEIRRRTEQLEALRQIELELTAELDLKELLLSISAFAHKLMRADDSGLFLYRPELDVLERAVSTGDRPVPTGLRIGRGEGLAGKVWEAGRPLFIRDYANWESRLKMLDSSPKKNAIGVPVRWGSSFLGVLTVSSTSEQKFDHQDVELLSLFATQAAIAIRNAQTIESRERQRLRAEALVRASQALASTLDLNELLEKLLSVAARAIPSAEKGLVFLIEEQTGDLAVEAEIGFDRRRIQHRRISSTDLSAYIQHHGIESQLLRDASEFDQIKTGWKKWFGPVQSMILCPIHARNQVIGCIYLGNYHEKEAFQTEDLALLEAFAGQAALAIEKARLYRRVSTSEERYALAMRGANDGLWDWDLRSNSVYYSPRWKTMLGFDDSEIGSSPEEWLSRIHLDDFDRVQTDIQAHLQGKTPHFESEHRIRRKDGSFRWVLARGLAVCEADQPPHRLAGSLTDIHERKATEERLRHDALHDPLTHLPNRVYFIDQLNRAMERAHRRDDSLAAVLFLDLDRFKLINDSLGHEAGDRLLVAIARRLEACLRHGDMVARFGGDEFAILIDRIDNLADATQVADRVQAALSKPLFLETHEVSISASVGIVLVSSVYESSEDLMRDVDTAMYRAKDRGRSRYEVFDEAMHANSMALLEMELELRRGLENQELELYYQPVIDPVNGRITAAEALLRWQHPTRGLLSPCDFMPILEETGMIVQAGEWALRRACEEARKWHAQGYPELRISVNLSARQLDLPELPEIVQRVLEETGLPPHLLELEVTESSAMQDIEQTIDILHKLKAMGVGLAIDDFGQCYSSLGYLKRFPVDTLKIDKSFVQNISSNFDEAIIMTAIIAMAHIMQLKVVAEGVENREQFEFLLPQCDEIQGLLISAPLPPEEFMAWLKGRTGLSARPDIDLGMNLPVWPHGFGQPPSPQA